MERVRELESRGETERDRERKKTVAAAEGEKVFGASDELTTKRQHQQTTVGVRGESCVPDAWGRDGGEVR